MPVQHNALTHQAFPGDRMKNTVAYGMGCKSYIRHFILLY